MYKSGVFFFEILKLPHQTVVLCVRDFGIVQTVVKVVVAMQIFGKFFRMFADF